MQEFRPLREVPSKVTYTSTDVLVVFGEVFARGYVNGLIDEAKKAGMKVIYATVGRRDENENLRALTAEELAQKDQPVINVALECGFDLMKSSQGQTPVEQVKGLKLSEWNDAKIDWAQLEESRRKGRDDFKSRVKQYMKELEAMIPSGANVLFAHTMAGGVPRAKIIMPVMNRVFKGHGERFTSSKEFWDGNLGKLTEQSFMDVTANSFADFIELSAPVRAKIEKDGGQSAYVAYGYHGTEILIGGKYKWQSYAPYLQGFAKLELERIAERAMKSGVKASVFNAPEILTNSSSIFLGVEVALYPLLGAFKKEAPDHPYTKQLFADCDRLLKEGHTADEVLKIADQYFQSDIIQKKWSDFTGWPQHNGPEQMAQMQEASKTILDMHKSDRELLTATLSEVVFKACGRAMITEGADPSAPVYWIGHDLVAKLALNN